MKIAGFVLLCALAIVLVIAFATGDRPRPTHAAHVTKYGQDVRIIDGDTLQVNGETFHLWGIDAPELGQMCDLGGRSWQCGRDAALELRKLVSLSGGPLVCSPWPQDGGSGEQNPAARVCRTEGEDLGLVLVQDGYALALDDSFPDYQEAQAYARQASLGVWRSDVDPPWRARQEAGDGGGGVELEQDP